ncbi:MAG: hypothetical protein ABS69_05475 [Nitrosomonadales bacterium SCN 54-20]|nr:MAG: hypothetical protein ABS69_05475 [Nitrosomonadales bacterium SCN 54-20]
MLQASPTDQCLEKSFTCKDAGDSFSFRVAHPDEFQAMTGKREFTKTLETADKSVAIPRVLMLAVEL